MTPEEKQQIERAAGRAGMEVSKWVLGKLVPKPSASFRELCADLSKSNNPSFILAEFNDFLTKLSNSELEAAVSDTPQSRLGPYLSNYLAAMIEQEMTNRGLKTPGWTKKILPLDEPVFASELLSLRLYLLTHSLPSFRRRNIFVDSSVGARV